MAAPTARPTTPHADAHVPRRAHQPAAHLFMKADPARWAPLFPAGGRAQDRTCYYLQRFRSGGRGWDRQGWLPTAFRGTTTTTNAAASISSSTRAAARKARCATICRTSGQAAVSRTKVASISIVCIAMAMIRSMCSGTAMIRIMRREMAGIRIMWRRLGIMRVVSNTMDVARIMRSSSSSSSSSSYI